MSKVDVAAVGDIAEAVALMGFNVAASQCEEMSLDAVGPEVFLNPESLIQNLPYMNEESIFENAEFFIAEWINELKADIACHLIKLRLEVKGVEYVYEDGKPLLKRIDWHARRMEVWDKE